MTTLYMIMEDGALMDGELYTLDRLHKVLIHADEDAEIFATDFDEARADGSTPTRLVTEDICLSYFNTPSGWNEVCARIEEGHEAPGLALRFFADECAAYTNRVEAA